MVQTVIAVHETMKTEGSGKFCLLNGEAFAAGAMGDCVGVGDFETAFLQVFAVIEHRAADEERALWIDNQAHV